MGGEKGGRRKFEGEDMRGEEIENGKWGAVQ